MSLSTLTDSPSPQFITAENGDRIAYHQLVPDNPAQPTVVFLGGFMSDMEGSKALALKDYCGTHGLGFVRFDYHGHGSSEGVFAEGTISRWTLSALAVIDQLTTGPLMLVGSSMGGWISLRCAILRADRVRALVGIAAAPDFTKRMWQDEFGDAERAAVLADGYVDIPTDYGDTPYRITKALIDDGAEAAVFHRLGEVQAPVHLLHGTADADVPVAVAGQIKDGLLAAGGAAGDVAVTIIEDGDHRLSEPENLELLTQIVGQMLDKCRG